MSGFDRVLQAMQRRVMLTVGRAVIRKISDSPKMQSVQAELLKGELRDDLERFQNYGYTSVPHVGAEGVAVFVGGNRDHGIVVCIDDRRFRLKNLQPGEVALYTDEGDTIHFKRGRQIEITTTTLKVTCDNAEITGNLKVGGNITSDQQISDVNGSMQEMRTRYNGHKHTETGSVTQVPDTLMT